MHEEDAMMEEDIMMAEHNNEDILVIKGLARLGDHVLGFFLMADRSAAASTDRNTEGL
jgi:hypothetical protein